jgi:hypothetical protein
MAFAGQIINVLLATYVLIRALENNPALSRAGK